MFVWFLRCCFVFFVFPCFVLLSFRAAGFLFPLLGIATNSDVAQFTICALLCPLIGWAPCIVNLTIAVLCNMRLNVYNDLARAKRRWTEKKATLELGNGDS